MNRFVIDAEWVRGRATHGRGRGVLAGSPPTWFSVTPAGEQILDALETGAPLPSGHEPLTSRLAARGAIHPVSAGLVDPDQITVVIPARIDARDAADLADLVAHLAPMRVVVVDDGSTPALALSGATVIAHTGAHGPGPARNTGLAAVTTPLVAFIDADASVDREAIRALGSLALEDTVAVVAPRVMSTPNGPLARYESTRSPLDLGDERALVRPLSRVSYVPAAVLVARTAVVVELGGFEESLRYGEDVDLIWRAVERGFGCRYEPSITAFHRPRRTLREFLNQRFRYGTSAGALGRRHGQAVAPLRATLATLAMSIAWLVGWWQVALPLTALVWLWFTLGLARTGLSRTHRGAIAGRALWRAITQTATAIRRTWWPALAVLGIVVMQARVMLAVAFSAGVVIGLAQDRPRAPFRWIALRVLDDLAYGAGVWRGALTARSFTCLVPVVSLRPGRVD